MSETSTSYWNNTREGLRIVELRAAGFKPADAAGRNAIVTVASPYTNAHRCNNRVRRIADLLVEMIAQRGGQGLLVGAPAVSDAL
jgi:dihydroxy-acid dehydratase